MEFYTNLRNSDIGSKAHITHFSTWWRTIFTLGIMSGSFTLLISLLMRNDVQWNQINTVQYAWAWTTWIVLSGVMTKLDWTAFGTFFEIFHPFTEWLLTFTCFGYFHGGIIICSILFCCEIIMVLRCHPKDQFAIAVIAGTLSHVPNLIFLIIFAATQQNVVTWLLPLAMMMHFTYDTCFIILSNTTALCSGDDMAYLTQIWLPVCNTASIAVIYACINTYTVVYDDSTEVIL